MSRIRSWSHAAGLAAVLLVAASAARAQWTEPRFDPPVGSRWIVKSEERTEEVKEHTTTTLTTATRELTIERRTADGFQVSYVTRQIDMTGTAPEVAVMQPLLGAFRNLVVRATLDANGKPVRIDNLPEVIGAARTLIDGILDAFKDKPQVAAIMRQFTASLLIENPEKAAEMYLENLPQLAYGQNTGLKPGESRTSDDALPNPLGGVPLKSATTLRLLAAEGGKARYLRTQEFDPEAVKKMTEDLMNRVGFKMQGISKAEIDRVMKMITFKMNERAELDVEDGMTREARREGLFQAEMMGHRMSKRTTTRITVERAP
jgi:hypothetical protein